MLIYFRAVACISKKIYTFDPLTNQNIYTMNTMSEITHTKDPDTGYLIQVVTPSRLRAILDDAGESHDRPSDFCDEDEWDTDSDLA